MISFLMLRDCGLVNEFVLVYYVSSVLSFLHLLQFHLTLMCLGSCQVLRMLWTYNLYVCLIIFVENGFRHAY